VVCAANLSPVPRPDYVIPLPEGGVWGELLNTDAAEYGGSGVGNLGFVAADGPPAGHDPHSARVTLPPLSVVFLAPEPR
jgi:1,4-alpha-glucan branching enzyme